MNSLDDVYRKFGDASEAAQLLETEVGNILLEIRGTESELSSGDRPEQATEVIKEINKSTLGQLLNKLKEKTNRVDREANLLAKALAERNRLSHSFFRQHNFRRNTDAGRAVMLADLEAIHATTLEAYEVALAISGFDLKSMANFALPKRHLKIR